jgi:aspartyl aminopeptidase
MTLPAAPAAVSDLCRFIDAAPCPWLAADTIAADLKKAGFTALDRASAAPFTEGRHFIRHGASVIAFVVRKSKPRRFALVGAHTDSPHLRLKPRPAYANEGYKQLAVEVYGGALHNSWLDRDLGLAGVVVDRAGKIHALRIDRAIARVAQLAIHLDRKVNDDGLKLNPQTQLAPLWGIGPSADICGEFSLLIAEACGVSVADIAAHDLSLFDLTPSALGGSRNELVFAPRLDNLASCHAGIQALIAAENSGSEGTVPVLACFDHEEVGSTSDTGAGGAFLSSVLERISLSCSMSRSEYLAALAQSLMLSADMAHAVHPNYADRHEPRHKPQLGQGPVLKTNHNQRYATSAVSAAAVRTLADKSGIALQDFVARTDLGCGSTIGPVTAAGLGISVADLGNPMLSMHSARECAAVADHAPYIALLSAHFAG